MTELAARVLQSNNARIVQADPTVVNPLPLERFSWDVELRRHFDDIDAEWSAAERAGRRFPLIQQLIGEHQGNRGSWRAGLLVWSGRPTGALAAVFPRTVEALGSIPGLRYALWSVLEPGTELDEHCGPNSGVLRYHLTVRSNPDAALRVGGLTHPYVAGESILFDDTAPHAAWNRGSTDRVSILCEIDRPLRGAVRWANAGVQRMLSLDPRYRRAARLSAEWDRGLNDRLLSSAATR